MNRSEIFICRASRARIEPALIHAIGAWLFRSHFSAAIFGPDRNRHWSEGSIHTPLLTYVKKGV